MCSLKMFLGGYVNSSEEDKHFVVVLFYTDAGILVTKKVYWQKHRDLVGIVV